MELTRHFQSTDALEQIIAHMNTQPVTLVVGGPGTGKSAIAAALTVPSSPPT